MSDGERVGSGRFDRAFGHHVLHGVALDPDLYVFGHFHSDVVFADVGHATQNATTGNDLVTLFQGGDHLSVLFGRLA